MKFSSIIAACCLAAVFITGCSKEKEDTTPATLNVHMTDAPGPYDSVLVDIQSVEITGSGGSFSVHTLYPGIYNLLDFMNGVDTLITAGTFPGGARIEQIRFILGPNNSIVVAGVNFPLSTPSAEQSGLKLQVHETLAPGTNYRILVDFDAEASIVEEGSGDYKLKPVLHLVSVVPL